MSDKIGFAKEKMEKEKCCYDNAAFVLTEKNFWTSSEVCLNDQMTNFFALLTDLMYYFFSKCKDRKVLN